MSSKILTVGDLIKVLNLLPTSVPIKVRSSRNESEVRPIQGCRPIMEDSADEDGIPPVSFICIY